MEIDPKIIKRTQDTLGKIIRKPTLTDKLLSRPPFRFLHDIFTAFIRTTGLMKGLFTAEELIADNVKEKESKLAFLQKVVDYLSIVHETTISIRIMSIIAGKDPEKTNELLFLLADAVNKGVNNDECVARVIHGGDKTSAKKSKSKSPEGARAASKEKARTEVKEKPSQPQGDKVTEKESTQKKDEFEDKTGKKHRRSEKEKQEDKAKKPSSRQKPVEHESEQANGEKKEEDTRRKNEKREVEKVTPDKKDREKTESGHQSHLGPDRSSRVSSRCEVAANEKNQEDRTTPANIPSESPVQPAKLVRPPSAKGNRVRKEDNSGTSSAMNSLQEEHKSGETLEARLAPPRPRKSLEPGLEEAPMMSGVSGQRTTGLIITETQQELEDDDDEAQFVIEETVGGDTGLMRTKVPGEQDQNAEEHGGLVTKMLQSKREFEGGNLMSNTVGEMHPQTLGTVDELTRQRERAQIEKEVTKLCETLQTLSRSAMPLGKLMDFVQEDLESMQQEYERWTNENQTLRVKLREEESRTQASIEPLKAQLRELENYAVEQRKAIANFKSKILANEERIQDLMAKSLERAH